MTITSYSQLPLGSLVEVTVTSDLSSPTIFWYVDGVYYSRTDGLTLAVPVEDGDLADVVAVDTTDPDNFDVSANAPTLYPARRSLWWTASTDDDVASYTVYQQREAEGYAVIAEVPASREWSYRVLTPRLDDLTTYDWTVYPVDAAGNEGTALALGPELIVRKPDAPNFAVAFDGGTTKVTFSAA